MNTSNIFTALLKNRQLTNSIFWKKLQSLVHVLIGVVPFLSFIFPQYKDLLDPVMLGTVEAALGSLATYFTFATTASIGLGKK